MPTSREAILTALADLLRTVPHVPVLRGEILPERISPAGLMILRDGDPGDPAVTLSPLAYHYQHRAELEVIVQGEARSAQQMQGPGDPCKEQTTATLPLQPFVPRSARSFVQTARSAGVVTGLRRKRHSRWTCPLRGRPV